MDFGRCRRMRLYEVEDAYSFWLTARHVRLDEDNRVMFEDHDEWGCATGWLWQHRRAVIEDARAYMSLAQRCVACGGRLVVIGHARQNGRDHPDWNSRQLHMRCWRTHVTHVD